MIEWEIYHPWCFTVVSVWHSVPWGKNFWQVIDKNYKKQGAKYWALRYTWRVRAPRRIHSVNHDSRFSDAEVILAPVQKCTRNTKIAQFLQQYIMCYSVKGLCEIQEYDVHLSAFIYIVGLLSIDNVRVPVGWYKSNPSRSRVAIWLGTKPCVNKWHYEQFSLDIWQDYLTMK